MSKSKLEEKFLLMWESLYPSLVLKREEKYLPHRRFRGDFVNLESKTVIEIQGGVWVGGRHSTGAGINKDCEKALESLLHGWAVIPITANMINEEVLEKISSIIMSRTPVVGEA